MWVLVSIILGLPGHELPSTVLFYSTQAQCEQQRERFIVNDVQTGHRVMTEHGPVVVSTRYACVPAYGDLDSILHPKH